VRNAGFGARHPGPRQSAGGQRGFGIAARNRPDVHQGIEPLFSTVELRDARGGVMATTRPRTIQQNNRKLVVEIPALSSGTYTVIWHATSVDTHKTEGSYRFTVK
jgi:methionine-rich copper-binding protein CopC